jgi:hypothetical protein
LPNSWILARREYEDGERGWCWEKWDERVTIMTELHYFARRRNSRATSDNENATPVELCAISQAAQMLFS